MSKIYLMISNDKLEQYKAQNICDVNMEDLKDISTVRINRDKPVLERVLSFMLQIGNPYLFKVGDIPVKVSFSDNAPTLQKSLEAVFTKNSR